MGRVKGLRWKEEEEEREYEESRVPVACRNSTHK